MGTPEAANLVYLGLYALQHRGQESADRVHGRMQISARSGWARWPTSFAEALKQLKGTRPPGTCATLRRAPEPRQRSADPDLLPCGEIAVAHNGNLVNAARLRSELEKAGSISIHRTPGDPHMIARSPYPDFDDALISALRQVEGAYSLVFLTRDRLVAARDPRDSGRSRSASSTGPGAWPPSRARST